MHVCLCVPHPPWVDGSGMTRVIDKNSNQINDQNARAGTLQAEKKISGPAKKLDDDRINTRVRKTCFADKLAEKTLQDYDLWK